MIRFLLGQAVLHVLKCDPVLREWYASVKKRRGSKIARVAVMRRISTSLWHMLKFKEPYRPGGSPARKQAGQRGKTKFNARGLRAEVSSPPATTKGAHCRPSGHPASLSLCSVEQDNVT